MAEEAAIDTSDVKNFLIGSAVTGVAFSAFTGVFTFENLAFYMLAGITVMTLREAGQRTVAHWMESYVNLKVSREGATVTLAAAVFSVVSDFSLLLMFPIYSDFSGERYEQWGKSIDAMWMKRQYWLSSAGIIGLWTGWAGAMALSLPQMAQAIAAFTLFQLMPFDYEKIPTDPLDGATILRWSGFSWLLMTGLTIVMIALTM
ncbi:hypothetical protein AQV86_04255 [Nanohaloarchaea archaeon SG9]|nr:hypothetical protein AQV86_04255 [Nanohaloarchaea archaeon SG9]